MNDSTSYQRALRSNVVIGGASAGNILIGIVRIKALAILLGPAGVGLAGMLGSILSFWSTLSGLGLANSGVRQLATSDSDPLLLGRVRHALFFGSLALGCVGGALLWLLRGPMSMIVFGDISQAGNIGWLGIGVLLTLLAASQIALLRGMHRVSDMARVTLISAVASTAGGVFATWMLGFSGVIVFVLVAPASGVIAGAWYAARLPRPDTGRVALADLVPEWRVMTTLGIVFMVTALLAEATQLFVRAEIGMRLSMVAVGHFQAVWTISMQYIGFVLTAMAADYYPRLASVANDPIKANRMVNEQVTVALLLAGPILLGMMTFAPWVISLLYSKDFVPSAEILRWQILGDLMKVASWPMGFILLARAERSWFLLTQSFWNLSFAGIVWLLLPVTGLAVTGYAFFACYCGGFALNILVSRRVTGFRYARDNALMLLFLLAATGTMLLLSSLMPMYSGYVGFVLTALCLVISLRRLLALYGGIYALPEPVAQLLSKFKPKK